VPAVVAITDNFDMVTVEKWQGEGCKPGSSVPGCFGGTGNTDKKIIGACAQLKKLKPSPPCIMYHDTNTVWDCADAGPPGFCSGRGLDNVAYDGAVQANSNPSKFLLHQPNGSLYVSSYVHAHVIDFRKKAGTALWVETCTNATATGMVDGCFADFCSWGLDNTQRRSQQMVLLRENISLGAGMWHEVRPVTDRVLPEIAAELGKPSTEAPLRQPNGSYTRSFASGPRAIFDPKTGLGKIFWAKKQYK